MLENKQKKTKRHKRLSKKITMKLNKVSKVPADWVAAASGTSVSTVFSIRNGNRNKEGKKAQKVEVAEMLLQEGSNKLIEQVKVLVKI
ncbi:MAG: hypothetical protein JST94_11945 [Bacteroidetes bacterium]|nr:hypothetical protein [Bacteroidota bacterium]MBS1672138.1 hypothetical protein [Bacteroidota bacterium]